MQFDFDSDRAIAAVSFLVSQRLPELTKWKICKLIYLADRLHLVRYGRPITGDVYYALPWGPVPSYTLNALDDENELAMEFAARFRKSDSQRYPEYFLNPDFELNLEDLSASDIKILNEIASRFGGMHFKELSDIVDRTIAYRRAWKMREGDRSLMQFEDFFADEPTAHEALLAELRENLQ